MLRTRIVTAVVCVGIGGPCCWASPVLADGASVQSPAKAGYVVTGRSLHAVSAQWTVPGIHCTAADSLMDVRAGLYGSSFSYLLGTRASCRDRSASYRAWYSLAGADRALQKKVAPGDRVKVSITYQAGGFEATFEDTTQHWGIGVSGAGTGGPRATGALVAVHGRLVAASPEPLARFDRFSLWGCEVDGQSLRSTGARRLVMHPPHGGPTAVAAGFKGPERFAVRWQAAR